MLASHLSLSALMLFLCAVIQCLFQEHQVTPKPKLSQNQTTESLERRLLIGANLARDLIGHADCARRITLLVDQWGPRVKPDVWFRHDEWIISESLIIQSIRYDKNVGLLYGCGAKCDFARSFRNGDSCFRFKSLPILINERDQGDRRLA